MMLQERRGWRGAGMTIVDEQHAIADEHFTADGHAGARIEENNLGNNPPYERY
ncbi:hypothetical protein [Bradyrhizobium centrolobii]|uniref:hypothetical protein n=1 Tax=Bradyrhizobium centrolobii TaxID=1505087 RepID=UPI0013747E73|nr:hypothetical protein [Bradyrhizobium centrolobii]